MGVQMAWGKSRGTNVIAVPPSWHTEACEGRKGAEEPLQPGSHQKYCSNCIKLDLNSATSLTSLQRTRGSESRRVACWVAWLGCFFQIACNLDCMQFRHMQADNNCWREGGRETVTDREADRKPERWGRDRWRGCWFEIIPLIQRTPVSRCFRDRWK